MYIRMKSGREPGRVVDMRDEEAKAMLADGRAVKVDFDDPCAFETKTGFEMQDQQAQLAEPIYTGLDLGAEPGIVASGTDASPVIRNPKGRRR